jgi:hypothetical protein
LTLSSNKLAAFDTLTLTQDEEELLCNITLDDHTPILKDEKTRIARKLAALYESGGKDVARDPHKAIKYKNIANQTNQEDSSIFTTSNFYTAFGWITSVRLLLARTNKLVTFIDTSKAFLPSLFNIGGFTYAIYLLTDIFVIVKSTFFDEISEEEKLLPLKTLYWQRFKNVMKKDVRPSRMLNDVIWLAINLAVFIITGGISVILNIIGFTFDIGHEIYNAIKEYKKYDAMIMKVCAEINHQQQEIKNTNIEINFLRQQQKEIDAILKNKNILLSKEEQKKLHIKLTNIRIKLHDYHTKLIVIRGKIDELCEVKSQLEKTAKSVLKNRIRIVAGVTLAFIGVLLISFPPTTIPAAVLIGSGATIAGGSVITGLGKRLWDVFWIGVDKLKTKFNRHAPTPQTKNVPVQIKTATMSQNHISTYTKNLTPLIPSPSLPIPNAIPNAIPRAIPKAIPNVIPHARNPDVMLEGEKIKSLNDHSSLPTLFIHPKLPIAASMPCPIIKPGEGFMATNSQLSAGTISI